MVWVGVVPSLTAASVGQGGRRCGGFGNLCSVGKGRMALALPETMKRIDREAKPRGRAKRGRDTERGGGTVCGGLDSAGVAVGRWAGRGANRESN